MKRGLKLNMKSLKKSRHFQTFYVEIRVLLWKV